MSFLALFVPTYLILENLSVERQKMPTLFVNKIEPGTLALASPCRAPSPSDAIIRQTPTCTPSASSTLLSFEYEQQRQDVYAEYRKACLDHDKKPLKVVFPNATQWWGLLYMVTRYFQMHDMLIVASRTGTRPGNIIQHYVLSPPQMNRLHKICEVLRDVWEISGVMQKRTGSTLVTAHDACAYLCQK